MSDEIYSEYSSIRGTCDACSKFNDVLSSFACGHEVCAECDRRPRDGSACPACKPKLPSACRRRQPPPTPTFHPVDDDYLTPNFGYTASPCTPPANGHYTNQVDLGAQVKCMCALCESYPALFYCRKCENLVCQLCKKSHVKISKSDCQEADSEEIDNLMEKRKKEIEAMLQKCNALNKDIESKVGSLEKKFKEEEKTEIEKVDEDEKAEMRRVKLRYEEERKRLTETTNKKLRGIHEREKKLAAEVENQIEAVRKLESANPAQMVNEAETTLKEISEKLAMIQMQASQIKEESSSMDSKYGASGDRQMPRQDQPKNCRSSKPAAANGEYAKPICVVQQSVAWGAVPSSKKTEEGGPVDLVGRKFAELAKVRLDSWAYKLLEVDGRIWCLTIDAILVFDHNGRAQKSIAGRFQEATSMARVGRDTVVVSSKVDGLVQVDINGCGRPVSRASYLDVCCDGEYLYGFCEGSGSSDAVQIQVFRRAGCVSAWQHHHTVSTRVNRSVWNLTCAVVRGRFYICPSGENCLFVVDGKGATLSRIASDANKLYISCWSNQGILLSDHENSRLLVLEILPTSNKFHELNVNLRQPRAALFTAQGSLVVAGSSGRGMFYLKFLR